MVYHTERKEACATTAVHIVMERGKEERFFKTQNMTIFLVLWIMTLKWCGFGSVSYSLFDTVSLNNLKLSKDIYLGGNFHTNFAVISNTFGLIIQKLR